MFFYAIFSLDIPTRDALYVDVPFLLFTDG